tara:strand:+ start:468 stop:683 length:216 start_codon:yes stop_codon:yes gene_type:complete
MPLGFQNQLGGATAPKRGAQGCQGVSVHRSNAAARAQRKNVLSVDLLFAGQKNGAQIGAAMLKPIAFKNYA